MRETNHYLDPSYQKEWIPGKYAYSENIGLHKIRMSTHLEWSLDKYNYTDNIEEKDAGWN